MNFIIIKTWDTESVLYRKIMDLASECEEPLEIISSSSHTTLSFADLEIRCGQQRVFRNGEDLGLTRLEYHLLFLLASLEGQVVPKKLILETIWGSDTENTQKVVANTISNLRGKIETDRQHPRYIHTAINGYMFHAR